MASAKYLGGEITKAVKLPCIAPPANTTLLIDSLDPKVSSYGQIGGRTIHPDTEWAGQHLIRNGDFGIFGAALGTAAMPDGWVQTVGTYGAAGDLYFEATTVRGGKYALKMRSTAVATAFARAVYDPVHSSGVYWLTMSYQMSSIAAGNDVNMFVDWYTSGLALISSSTIAAKAAVINTWETRSLRVDAPATARWAKVRIAKTAFAFDVFVNKLTLQFTEAALPGSVIGYQRFPESAYVTGTTTVALADAIPAGTAGVQMMSTTYTPKVIGSTLIVRAQAICSLSVSALRAIGFINKDAGAALAVASQYLASAGEPGILTMSCQETVASLAAATWRVRCGASAAATTRLNGAAAREFGGVNSSWIEFTEYAP